MSPGGGELSLSVCLGVGNRTSSTQMPGGGMVTGRIEQRISSSFLVLKLFLKGSQLQILISVAHLRFMS